MRFPISLKITLIILLSLALQAAMVLWYQANAIKQDLLKEITLDTQLMLTSHQQFLGFLAQNNQFSQLQQTVTALGSDTRLNFALLLDENNTVIAATRVSNLGQDLMSLLTAETFTTVQQRIPIITSNLKTALWQSDDDQTFYALAPIELGRSSPTSLRLDQIGYLYVQYELDWIRPHIKEILLPEVIPIIIMMSLFTLLLILYFNYTISRRILLISDATSQFSLGKPFNAPPLSGSDELTELNQAFLIMAQQANQQHTELRQNEQNLALTLHSIGDAVVVTDAQGIINKMNPVAEQLTGWHQKQAMGKELQEVFPIINASTRQPIANPVEKVIASGKTVYLSNHTTLLSKNGREVQISDSAAPIIDKGTIIGVILVFNDVSEAYRLREQQEFSHQNLIQSEARLKEAQSISHLGNWELDLTTNEMVWSDETYRILGYEPQQFKPTFGIFIDTVHPDDRTLIDKAITEPTKEKINREIIHRLILSNDTIRHVREYCRMINHDNGKAQRILGTIQDITEQKQQEQMLQRSQKMDALGKLTGGIAHDFNNMLSVALGYTRLLQDNLPENSKQRQYTDEILHAAERAKKLTAKLLAFSSNKPASTEIIDINALLRDDQHMLEKTLTARIKLNLELASDLWPVQLDPGDLEDAILNITINAMHAMPSGGILTVSTSNIHLSISEAYLLDINPGDYILLTLTDTGIGMDQETRLNLFDPFFTTKGSNGTGLGMSQVYGFLKQSQGAINVYSESGHGTRIALYFPRYQTNKAVGNVDDMTVTGKMLGGNETILVVDDELSLCKLAREILESNGYRVFTATGGEQALTVLETEKVDLLLTDIIMPGMDGYQLANHVHQNYPEICIQLSSGFNDDRHSDVIGDHLLKNLLQKPFSSEVLLQHIRQLLDSRKQLHRPEKSIIMIIDDDENVRELYRINLERLGFRVITAQDGDQAIDHYQQSLKNQHAIALVILDLTIPGHKGGLEIAKQLRALNPDVKMIVSSGDSYGTVMTDYKSHGFQAALEKSFDRTELAQLIERVLS